MIAKGGAPLLQNDAISALKKHLLPLAEVVTPNIPEAEALTGIKIETIEDRFESAKHIFELGARNVVIKGGHEIASEAVDVLYDGREFYYFKSKKSKQRTRMERAVRLLLQLLLNWLKEIRYKMQSKQQKILSQPQLKINWESDMDTDRQITGLTGKN